MNVEALKKARDCLAKSTTYDQAIWAHQECGSPACVAGHIVVANGCRIERLNVHNLGARFFAVSDDKATEIELAAASIADLDDLEMADMFDGNVYCYDENNISPTKGEALAMLDHAIEHGEVRWPRRE